MWSEKQARMALSCAVDGGDPEAGQLVARIGAQAAWTKIVEGLLGEPLARRAAATDLDAVQRLAERSGARFVVPGEEEWADSGTTWLDSAALAEGTPSCGDDA